MFLAAAIAQALVIVMYFSLCIGLSLALQAILPSRAPVAGSGRT